MISVVNTREASFELRKQVMAKVLKESYTAPVGYPMLIPPNTLVILETNACFKHSYRFAAWCSEYDTSLSVEEYLAHGSR